VLVGTERGGIIHDADPSWDSIDWLAEGNYHR
jgi:hypothetical protein